jgi:hypothetical protein
MRYVIGVLLLCAAAWWFLRGEADYPKDWPRPTRTFLSHRGGCPDLNATFTEVNSELPWLLGHDPDYFVARKPWVDSRATIVQSPDGDSMTISFSFSPKGFEDFRQRMIKYNTESNGRVTAQPVTLKRGVDFECSRGWLYGNYFPEAAASHGWQRQELKLGRDNDGGLIAGARITKQSTIGWGDSPRISLGRYDETTWYRWPKDDPATDAALAKLQTVDLHRYGWKNHGGTTMPIRFTSFYLEPICVQFVETDTAGNSWGHAHSGPEQGASDVKCPEKWGKFDLGEVLREDMDIPSATAHRYRIEWFPWSARDAKPNVIDVADVQALPSMSH